MHTFLTIHKNGKGYITFEYKCQNIRSTYLIHLQLPRCVDVVNKRTVHLNPPETSRAYISGRQVSTAYSFKEVFDGDANQKQVFDHVSFSDTITQITVFH